VPRQVANKLRESYKQVGDKQVTCTTSQQESYGLVANKLTTSLGNWSNGIWAYLKNHTSKVSNFTKYSVHVNCCLARSSYDDNAICYVFPDLQMTSCFHIMGQLCKYRCRLAVFNVANYTL